ncbi:MAG: MFS transporter [Alphaproteobacteria bacterium]
MNDKPTSADAAAPPKAGWKELFREGQAVYSLLILGGVALHALNVLIIAIVMPTVVADIGGADFYTWPAMLYTIGAIIGAASVGPVWNFVGPRRGYALGGVGFMLGTLGCALAPDMVTLVAARAVQGYASGMIAGGGMALVSGLFAPALRTRMLAMNQGIWMVAQLFGPAVGGAFAELGWWRGSFWTMIPILLAFSVAAWIKLPDRLAGDESQPGKFPVGRLALLASGVFCVALAGSVDDTPSRGALILAGLGLLALTFRLDSKSANRLYPSGAFSLRSPVGLALWILMIGGMVQTSVPLFLPLLLQVVHGVTPLFVSFVSVAISFGWTLGTFAVSGWSGRRERAALWMGPLLMMAGLAGIVLTATQPMLLVLTLSATLMGFGVGTHNVHLLSRTIGFAKPGEERITAAALPSCRSLGTALGAAFAGLLANISGLGDATEPGPVGDAVSFVYTVNLIPLGVAVLFMFMLVRKGEPPDRAG